MRIGDGKNVKVCLYKWLDGIPLEKWINLCLHGSVG